MKENNVRKKEESLEVKKRKRIFIYTLILVLSVIFVYILTTYILTIANVINQGNFRISDFVITSKVNVEEVGIYDEEVDIYGEENKKEEVEIYSDIENDFNLLLDVSQENVIDILIPKSENVTISKVYLSKIAINNTDNKIEMIDLYDNVEPLNNRKNLDLLFTEEESEYLIKIKLINNDIIKNASLPNDIKEVIYDGTILKTLGYDLNKLYFNFRANLNIVDSTGKTSVCNIRLELPRGELGENGIVIEREDASKYVFTLKSKLFELFD